MHVRPVLYRIRLLAAFATVICIMCRTNVVKKVTESAQKHIKYTASKTIVLAVVVCPPPTNFDTRDEATVLLKSIIISAKLNNISKIKIYFFVENMSREKKYFLKTIDEFGYPFSEFELVLIFQSALVAIPQKHRTEFVAEAENISIKRCTNVRLFIQSALPQEDAVAYFDTDIVVHGNLAELWNTWNLMNEEQLIGVASDYEEGNWLSKYYKNFIYPPPRYLNAGVLLMNLTRMRMFDWERKLLRIWNDYRYTIRDLNDQIVINMNLAVNTYLLYRLPCHFNYMHQHCESNSRCKTAEKSSVQIIHGAGGWFDRTTAHASFYLVYRELNMSKFNFNSIKTFRAFVHKTFNNLKNIHSDGYDILSEVIK